VPLVLVVSDDHLEKSFLEAALQRGGDWQVGEGQDGARPDVVLLDLEMPGALDFLAKARRDWPGSALVVRSGRSLAEVGLAGQLLGAVGYLHEDLDALELGEELSRLLALLRRAEQAVKRRLAAHPRSALEARQAVTGVLQPTDLAGVADDAALLVTELVSNAVVHACSEVEVSVLLRPGNVRVEVTDFSARGAVKAKRAPEDAEEGRGLTIVGTLASRWGVNTVPDGKTVWFELDRAPGA
jgi:anti-sigma regulatory factor (Ser/Thr protein kinase)